MGRHIFERRFFCQILNVADTFKKCKNNRVIKFLAFYFCNNCLFVEVSNNEIFDFLSGSSCISNFVDGGSMTNAKIYQGLRDDKKVKEHCSKYKNQHNFYYSFTTIMIPGV